MAAAAAEAAAAGTQDVSAEGDAASGAPTAAAAASGSAAHLAAASVDSTVSAEQPHGSLGDPLERELLPAEAAALPPDAPPGHEAHTLVRWDLGRWPLAKFTHQKTKFQTTMNAAGSKEAALRIARLCFIRFTEGASLDEVKRFRELMYAKLKEARGEKKPAEKKPKAEKEANGVVQASQETQAEPPPPAPEPIVYAPLPDDGDAPVGCPSYTCIRYDKANSSYKFTVPIKDDRGKVSLKPNRLLGDEEETKRILRLCYVKFLLGATKEDVYAYREHMVERFRSASGAEKGAAKARIKDDAGKEDGADGEKKRVPHRRKAVDDGGAAEGAPKAKEAKTQMDRIPGGGAELDQMWETLATEGARNVSIKFRQQGQQGIYWFDKEPRSAGDPFRFQVTLKSVGGAHEVAQKVLRLCFVKYEQGASKAELEEYRGKIVALVAGHGGGTPGKPELERRKSDVGDGDAAAPKAKRPKTAGAKAKALGSASSLTSTAERLRAEGRLEGALRLHGRAEHLKNDNINGIYAMVKGGFEGKPAWEKADGSIARFLFFSSRKGRWKINVTLDDEKSGFAYAKDSGQKPPGLGLRWHIFDGSGRGYNEDQAVRCEPLLVGENSKDEPADGPAAAPAEAGNEAGEAVGGGGEPGEPGEAEKAKAASSDSGSEGSDEEASQASSGGSKRSGSSSSDSSDEAAPAEEAVPSGSPPVAPPAGAPSPSAPAAGSVPAPSPSPSAGAMALTPPRPPDGKPRRVCAKLLVRSGLRCMCHFAYISKCPG